MTTVGTVGVGGRLSAEARARMLSVPGEPLFIAHWDRVLMLHYEVDPRALQGCIPFELDLFHGSAFVSLVAFTMRNMRPRVGGKFGALLLKPIANHEFLNVRTYVRNGSESGIYFMAEWLPNRLSVALGPSLFGLPYKCGAIHYHHDSQTGKFSGHVRARHSGETVEYNAPFILPSPSCNLNSGDSSLRIPTATKFEPFRIPHCVPRISLRGSVEEWLMERYTAFTAIGDGTKRFFRVWHPPWLQSRVDVTVTSTTLLQSNWPFFRHAQYIGATYSPGLDSVWMGRPHRLKSSPSAGGRIRGLHPG